MEQKRAGLIESSIEAGAGEHEKMEEIKIPAFSNPMSKVISR
jgi:hypothetical protein